MLRIIFTYTKKNLIFLSILLVSLVTLVPSFKLGLTGDDYLGLWRFNENLYYSGALKYNYFNYLLTDYGPQDSMTALIHHFFGFNSFYYYLVSFVFRFLAALSFYPLVKLITSKKTFAYASVLFFSITTIGLETTDWSFNVPSYVAIIFLNILFYFVFKSLKNNNIKLIPVIILLFALTVITQPIRMTFLPVFLVSLLFFYFAYHKNSVTLKFILLYFAIFMGVFLAIFKFTEIGGSIGLRNNSSGHTSGFWETSVGNYFIGFKQMFDKQDYRYFLNPVAQIGTMVLPTNFLPTRYQKTTNENTILIFTIFILAALFFIYKSLSNNFENPVFSIFYLLSVFWAFICYRLYIRNAAYPLELYEYLSYIVGGLYLIILLFIFLFKAGKEQKFLLTISLFLIFIPYIIPWIRTPGLVHLTMGRYLIVPAVGFTLLNATLLYTLDKKKKFIYLAFFLLVTIHILSSYKYLRDLNNYRNRDLAERVRTSVPLNPKMGEKENPQVYYFKTDNDELLRHTLLFGFPVIMAFEQNFTYPWSIAYTQNFNEVICSVKDGSGLKRFVTIPLKQVAPENVYSYYLKLDGTLLDTTEETRTTLNNIIKEGFVGINCQ